MAKFENYVYLIKSGTEKNAPIKIGVASSPEKRILDLQVGNPRLLTLVCKIKASSRKHAEHLEYSLHRYFRHAHIRGEWFKGNRINLAKAFSVIDESLVAEVVVGESVHGSRKDSQIQSLSRENQGLKKTIEDAETGIDDDLDRIMLINTKLYD